nr:MAG TPA: hypothetical protein [Caudoviricetes sp.]
MPSPPANVWPVSTLYILPFASISPIIQVQALQRRVHIRKASIMEDYNKIILTAKEKLFLFSLRFLTKHKWHIDSPQLKPLFTYKLISINYLPDNGPEPRPVPDGTLSLTDIYKRYCIYQRRQRIYRYLTPIAVSAATTVVLHILQQLWLPVILVWLQDRF